MVFSSDHDTGHQQPVDRSGSDQLAIEVFLHPVHVDQSHDEDRLRAVDVFGDSVEVFLDRNRGYCFALERIF